MRSPETAVPLARWLFGTAALVFGIVSWTWRWLETIARRVVVGITELPVRTFWILVCTLAVVPRFLIAITISYQPTADAWWYHEAATSLAAGQGLAVGGELTAYRAPGYPLLLSLTYRLFGPDLALAWIWGVLSSAVTIGAIHVIGRRLHSEAVARLAAVAAAVYPALVLMTGQSLSDLPFVAGLLLIVVFVLVGVPYGVLGSVVVGIAIAMLTLTRGVGAGLVVVVPLIWLLRRQDVRRFATSLAVIALAFAAGITPWILRNRSVFGVPTLATNFGTNLYVGNHHGSPGGFFPAHWPTPPPSARGNEARVDRALLQEAIDFVVASPWEAAAILPKKLTRLYLLEMEVVTSLFQGEHPSPTWMKHALYATSQVVYLFSLILFCARAFELSSSSLRPCGAQWTGWLFVGYFTCLCLVFHGQDRYRLPILPWILIEASVVLARMAVVERKQPRRT